MNQLSSICTSICIQCASNLSFFHHDSMIKALQNSSEAFAPRRRSMGGSGWARGELPMWSHTSHTSYTIHYQSIRICIGFAHQPAASASCRSCRSCHCDHFKIDDRLPWAGHHQRTSSVCEIVTQLSHRGTQTASNYVVWNLWKFQCSEVSCFAMKPNDASWKSHDIMRYYPTAIMIILIIMCQDAGHTGHAGQS